MTERMLDGRRNLLHSGHFDRTVETFAGDLAAYGSAVRVPGQELLNEPVSLPFEPLEFRLHKQLD
jgi:hypothetical protein